MKPLQNVKSMAKSTKKSVANNASDIIDSGKRRAAHLYDDAQSTLSNAEKQVVNYSKKASKKIQKNPTPFVLAVIGIGFLFASFLKRK